MKAKKKTKIGPELHLCPLCDQKIYTGKRAIELIQIEHPTAIAGRMDCDHIEPVIAVEDSGKEKDWNKVIARMFCDENNVQNICWICHKSKSLEERTSRTKARKLNKQ